MDWNNDGVIDEVVSGSVVYINHTFPAPGVYTIRMRSTNMRWSFNNSGDKNKLMTIDQWGTATTWGSMSSAFYGASNLRIPATDAPKLGSNVSFANIFRQATSLNDPIGHWDTSSVTNMNFAFEGATNFNQPLNNWNTSNVTNMNNMFASAYSFNQPINRWNTSNVTDMGHMFYIARDFNQPLNTYTDGAGIHWDVSNVTTMNNMFDAARSFNQPLSNWNTSKVSNMGSMFRSNNATIQNAFDQDLGNWNVTNLSSATTMLVYSRLSVKNYDSLLISWASQGVKTGVVLDGGYSRYCAGESARQTLMTTYGWSINDG